MPTLSTGGNSKDTPFVSVTVDAIDFDDVLGKFNDPDTGAIWTDYIIINKYENDRHVYMLPITSPDGFQSTGGGRSLSTGPISQATIGAIPGGFSNQQTAAFVQLAAPTLLWICQWTVCRYAKKPIIPDPTPRNSNWVLLDILPETRNIAVGADGVTPLFRISGTYVYGHRNPTNDPFLSINWPRVPWLDDFENRQVSQGMYQQGLSDL